MSLIVTLQVQIKLMVDGDGVGRAFLADGKFVKD